MKKIYIKKSSLTKLRPHSLTTSSQLRTKLNELRTEFVRRLHGVRFHNSLDIIVCATLFVLDVCVFVYLYVYVCVFSKRARA